MTFAETTILRVDFNDFSHPVPRSIEQWQNISSPPLLLLSHSPSLGTTDLVVKFAWIYTVGTLDGLFSLITEAVRFIKEVACHFNLFILIVWNVLLWELVYTLSIFPTWTSLLFPVCSNMNNVAINILTHIYIYFFFFLTIRTILSPRWSPLGGES